MEIFFYYLRDEGNHPYGCVAIQETSDGMVNRGVSICSKRDRFDRQHARGLALMRLKEASSSFFCKPFGSYKGDKQTMPEVSGIPFEKCSCHSVPTEFEKRILRQP